MAEGTNYKWNPGHYLLPYGRVQTVRSLCELIKNDDNILGLQVRYGWPQLEATRGIVNVDKIIEDLEIAKSYGKRIRILLMIKGLLGGAGVPAWMKTDEFEGGVWEWGLNPDTGTYKNEHPKLYLDNVRDRLVFFCGELGKKLDSWGKPADDPRHWLEDICFNETSWGSGWEPASWTPEDKTANLRKVGLAFRAAHRAFQDNMKGHMIGHFVNFPNNAAFSILSDPIAGLPADMREHGVSMAGPDSWLDDYDADRGCFKYYPMADGITAVCTSVQNANYQHWNHDDQKNGTFRYNITIQQLYDHVTTAGITFNGTFKPGLRATHVVWAAMDSPISGSSPPKIPLNDLLSFLRKKWSDPGPDQYNVAPGVITAVPEMLRNPTPPVPVKLVPSLTTDTGVDPADKITSSAAITLGGLASGATKQWALSDTGPWTNGDYAPTQGANTVYFRQIVAGVPGPVSDPFSFTYDSQAPTILRIAGNGPYVWINYSDDLPLSNVLKADKACYGLRKNGGAPVVPQGVFVSETLKYVRLEMSTANALVAGSDYTVDYTPPTTGNLRVQDAAGNYAAGFAGLAVNNNTGQAAPTTTSVVKSVAGLTVSGLSTNTTRVVVTGTISAPLTADQEIEVQRGVHTFGYATATGTNWTITDPELQTTGTRGYRARVRDGELVGPWSEVFQVTFDTKEPAPPSVPNGTVPEGSNIVLRGSWGAEAGEILELFVNGQRYSTNEGLSTAGTVWTLALGVLPPGRYTILARSTDPAGNVAESDGDDVITVESKPSIHTVRLLIAARRPVG